MGPASKSKSTSKSTSALVSALLAASKSALKSSKSKTTSTSSNTNCFTNNDTDNKNNATTNVNATFTMGMEYEEDTKDENEEADSAFANNKKYDDSMRTNTDIESDRSTHISF